MPAQLLDYIYCDPHVAESVANASEIGRTLYSHTKDVTSCIAARERRDLLTRYVDDIATKSGPLTEVLAVAAGHLREANRSAAVREGRLKRWVALDQDPQSVGLIARDFRDTAVEAVDGSVRTLLTRGHKLGKFDFIYASGLYDYLAHNVAVKLTKTCLPMLKPNGTFLFANYSEGNPDAGYRETFMGHSIRRRNTTRGVTSHCYGWTAQRRSVWGSMCASVFTHCGFDWTVTLVMTIRLNLNAGLDPCPQ